MHCSSLLVAVTSLVTLSMLQVCLGAPLDLGPGGVFNGDDANDYWAKRFGSGFFADLAARQRGSSSTSSSISSSSSSSSNIRASKQLKQDGALVVELQEPVVEKKKQKKKTNEKEGQLLKLEQDLPNEPSQVDVDDKSAKAPETPVDDLDDDDKDYLPLESQEDYPEDLSFSDDVHEDEVEVEDEDVKEAGQSDYFYYYDGDDVSQAKGIGRYYVVYNNVLYPRDYFYYDDDVQNVENNLLK